jgi:hypothetical protein
LRIGVWGFGIEVWVASAAQPGHLLENDGTGCRSALRGPAGLISPAALMSIRNLELRARVVVEGFWSGLHRSPYHGFSVEFTEYRQYTPGDDPRYLDWRLYARSDRLARKTRSKHRSPHPVALQLQTRLPLQIGGLNPGSARV